MLNLKLWIHRTAFAVSCAAMIGNCRPSFAQSKVELVKQSGRFALVVNGNPFSVKGVGGDSQLAVLSAAGGNAIRTWDSSKLGTILDEAQQNGLMVCAGLWLGHQRHGFDYQNQDAVLAQLEEKLAFVRKHKDHPALLMWGVGNEMEGVGTDPSVWYAVNHLAREIKKVDPNHPTITIIAELGEGASKVNSIERFCPDVDIVGINSYGGIDSIAQRFAEAKSTKPYIITEHGTLGPWEIGKTSWGSPIEFTSTEKGDWYARGYQANAVKNAGRCLGTFAFLWGHKQETSATWFGMLLPDGSRLAAVEKMSEAWTGKPPKNRCPQIDALKLVGTNANTFEPGKKIQAALSVSDPDGDQLQIRWILRSDSATIGEGGDPQEAETAFANAVQPDGTKAIVTTPAGGGGYRLFAYIFDGQGNAAVGNLQFRVAAPMQLKSKMKESSLPFAVYEDDSSQTIFAPSGYMGNADAVSMQLDCTEQPHSGKTCLKAEYKSNASWGGVLWQSPAEDWDGKLPGGANLTGAKKLEFWVRGKEGGEQVNFVFGVLDGNQPYKDSAKGELANVKLTDKWQKMTIALEGLDMRQIKTGFGWSLAGQGQPVTFYLDDIRYLE
ncbi:MAG: glycoside hydrolase family 2 TIM barrel-domain containing protein [Planctomycetota bacterium]